VSLIRVFEIPPPTGNFHFAGGERQTFVEVDWFRDDDAGMFGAPDISTPVGRAAYEQNIRGKRYFRAERAYLVLHPTHPFTINYEAP
jgi:hypothetical protein